jgi:hypothetical protein
MMNEYGPERVKLDLSREEFQMLVLALGVAAGSASKDMPQMAHAFIALADAVHKDDPDWRPYGV